MNTFKFRNATAALVFGLAVAATATAALAKDRAPHAGYAARAQAIEAVIDGGVSVSPDRAEALRACNNVAGSFKDYTWGVTQIDVYRNCMVQHGQPE